MCKSPYSHAQKNLLIYGRQKGFTKNNFFPNSLYTLVPKCISLSHLKKKLPFSKPEPHTVVAGFWFLAG